MPSHAVSLSKYNQTLTRTCKAHYITNVWNIFRFLDQIGPSVSIQRYVLCEVTTLITDNLSVADSIIIDKLEKWCAWSIGCQYW